MRKTLITLLMTAALSCWSFAQANPNSKNTEEKSEHKTSAQMKDADASNPNGSVSITSGPNVNAQSNSATITWTTNNRAATIVHYGTDVNNLSEKSRQPGGERDHSVTLSNLQPGTHYFFAIMTDDNTVRQKGEFTTQGGSSASTTSGASSAASSANGGAVSIVGPVQAVPSNTSATITWTTNKNAANEIRYGTSQQDLSQHWYEPGGSTQHSATLSNLQPGTQYYFIIMERNGSMRTGGQFKTTGAATATASTAASSTGAVQIAEQPKIPYLGARNVQISWVTNAPANSIVKYGTSMTALNQTAEGAWGKDHSVSLRNLQPNTQYYFQVYSGQTVNPATASKGSVEGFKTLQLGQQAQMNAPCCTVFSQ